jgi:hypothetical protein
VNAFSSLRRRAREFQLVGPALAGFEFDQLAPRSGVESSGGSVRARLDPDDVSALTEHSPDEVVGELVTAKDWVGAESELVIDHRDGDAPIRLGALDALFITHHIRDFHGITVSLRPVVSGARQL